MSKETETRECPAGKESHSCPCPEYSKEGFCDYPYIGNMKVY